MTQYQGNHTRVPDFPFSWHPSQSGERIAENIAARMVLNPAGSLALFASIS